MVRYAALVKKHDKELARELTLWAATEAEKARK